MADEVRVGLLGLGVVGAGVARTLEEKADTIARRVGRPIRLARVLVRQGRAVQAEEMLGLLSVLLRSVAVTTPLSSQTV